MKSTHRIVAAVLIGACVSTPLAAQDSKPPANRQEWTIAIRKAFSAHKPKAETIRGVTGDLRSELSITVLPDGSISEVTVKRSSGFQPVDAAASEMIRTTGRLPAFTPDMPQKELNFVLPVGFHFDPQDEADTRLYIDSINGMRLELQEPFVIRSAPSDPSFDTVVQIMAGNEPPSYAIAGEPLCIVGFKKAGGDDPDTQDELNAPFLVELTRDLMIKGFSSKGLEAERSDVTDYRSAKLIELRLKPKPGFKWPDRRFHVSSFDRPGGGVVVTCVATAQNMPAALDAFRSIRDGISIAPR